LDLGFFAINILIAITKTNCD